MGHWRASDGAVILVIIKREVDIVTGAVEADMSGLSVGALFVVLISFMIRL